MDADTMNSIYKTGDDPRPDLTKDHADWQRVLTDARGVYGDSEAFWFLQGFRCIGAEIERTPAGKLVIRAGEIEPTEYDRLRAKYLAPYRSEIMGVLIRAAVS